ncbi:MAG: thiazole biosynthesis adenylyltransferase ThiF, partial [Phycisphaerae bacterium]|nr:thiazole biosynthesis adenylyltransferase ThiF [Phycisphaerae bacterium]
PCCGRGNFEFLAGRLGSGAISLCGRDAVQVAAPAGGARVDFARIADRLRAVASPTFNDYMLKFAVEGVQITVFSDGRAIIVGTHDPAHARTIYSRYVGS